MELGTDYKFRDDLFDANEDKSTCPIELILDPFAGVVYRYTTVRFKVDKDDVPRLQYDYEILKTNHLSMITLRKNKKFNQILGLVLNAMLLDLNEAESTPSDTTETVTESVTAPATTEPVVEPVTAPAITEPVTETHIDMPLHLGVASEVKVGTSNIKEPDTERKLYQEGFTFPQG